ncbi:MAG: hypothetical protein JWL77_2666 [Chthonomonadaceae bacterium]|nr:hypothetical protein [Chthonomonadaceae bacterium]
MMESETKDSILNVLSILRKRHPLRQQVMSTFLDPQTPVQDLQPVLRALTGAFRPRKNEPLVAFWLIVHVSWTDDQRITLSKKLSITVDKAAKGRRLDRTLLRWFLRFMSVSALLFLFIYSVPFRGLYRIAEIIVEVGMISLILSIPLTLAGYMVSLPLSLKIDRCKLAQLTSAVEALGELGQPACIASLAKATVHSPQAAASALTRVMAGLQSDDLGALPGQTVPALCSVLTATSPETALVILQALTLIGDRRAIRNVESLSRNHFRPEVREAATKLLPILRQRDLEHQSSSHLLRASNALPDSGQTLLRATQEQPTADPSQLLRMATPADSDRP